MRRVAAALSLRDNDALWSLLAALEYYARLYEAMPERIRRAGEGSLDVMRSEATEATAALMHQHRDALERCKTTIQLAESMTREHEERYRTALARLNDIALDRLVDRAANRIGCMAGNRLTGALAIAARGQRERLDQAIAAFEHATREAGAQAQAVARSTERRFVRALRNLLAGAVIVLLVAGGATALLVWWGTAPAWVSHVG
ncbi:hypothetical protein [Paraburkholderia bryophila]|uniref:hypothetical protein n=1 Tax=Paraburkholderia bryophila TaxID=420952 RepID=UPI00359C92CF